MKGNSKTVNDAVNYVRALSLRAEGDAASRAADVLNECALTIGIALERARYRQQDDPEMFTIVTHWLNEWASMKERQAEYLNQAVEKYTEGKELLKGFVASSGSEWPEWFD